MYSLDLESHTNHVLGSRPALPSLTEAIPVVKGAYLDVYAVSLSSVFTEQQIMSRSVDLECLLYFDCSVSRWTAKVPLTIFQVVLNTRQKKQSHQWGMLSVKPVSPNTVQ